MLLIIKGFIATEVGDYLYFAHYYYMDSNLLNRGDIPIEPIGLTGALITLVIVSYSRQAGTENYIKINERKGRTYKIKGNQIIAMLIIFIVVVSALVWFWELTIKQKRQVLE